jgi:alkylated DNA repair dioxygenase AlkB
MSAGQISLFGGGEAALDIGFRGLARVALDSTAWVDHLPSWVAGHEGLLHHLTRTTDWQSLRRPMYDRVVDVPRLVASVPADGPGHPLLEQARRALSLRYRTEFTHITLALYRDGRDSVAWHGDYVAREMVEDTLVASVSLGAPRRLLLRPMAGGATRAFSLGWGDLFVMGGACQRTWQHAIPKVAHADPRLVIMFRPTWYRPPA